MECLLQFWDEIDDAVGALRQWWLSVQSELQSVLLACWAVTVFGIATLLSPGVLSVAVIAVAASFAIAQALRREFARYNAP
jgi:hypothetical protein